MALTLPDVPEYAPVSATATIPNAPPGGFPSDGSMGTPTGFGQNFVAGVKEGLRNTSIGLASRLGDGRGAPISEEEFNQSYANKGLTYQAGMTAEDAETAYQAQIHNASLAQLRDQSTGWGTVGFITGNIVGGIPDPLNLLPFGEVKGVANVGEAILKGAAVNVGQAVAVSTPLEYMVDKREQTPMTITDVAWNLGMAGALGGFFGALGHGANRLTERATAFALPVDEHGQPVPLPDSKLPQDNPTSGPSNITSVTDEELVRRALGGDTSGATAGASVPQTPAEAITPTENGKPVEGVIPTQQEAPTQGSEPAPTTQREADVQAALAPQNETQSRFKTDPRDDAKILSDKSGLEAGRREGIVNDDVSARDVELQRDQNGARQVVDPNSGEILFDEGKRVDELSEHVSKENAAMKTQLETLFRDKMNGEDAVSHINRENAVGGMLKQNAQQDAMNTTETVRPTKEPEGTLELRQSPGNRTKVKQVSLSDFWKNTRRIGNTIGVGTRDATRWGTMAFDRLARLTREQFEFTVDHLAQTTELKRVASAANIAIEETATKREIGDAIYQNMHNLNKDVTMKPVLSAERAPVVEAATQRLQNLSDTINESIETNTKALEDILARDAELAKAGASEQQLLENEMGTSEIETADEAMQAVDQAAVAESLSSLSAKDPEVAKLVADIRRLKDKKSAIKQAMVCLLGGSSE